MGDDANLHDPFPYLPLLGHVLLSTHTKAADDELIPRGASEESKE